MTETVSYVMRSNMKNGVSLLSMTLKKHGKENHQPEQTLTKFANIHIQNDTKYRDAA